MTLFDTDEPGGSRPKRKPPPDQDPENVPHSPEVLLRRSVGDNVEEHWPTVRKALQTPGVDLDSVVNTIALAESDAGWRSVDAWCAAAGVQRPHELPGERLAPLRMRYLLIIRDLVRAEIVDRAKREGLLWT